MTASRCLKVVPAALAASAVLGMAVAWAGTSPSMEYLAGRWLGEGNLIPVHGPILPFKCVVTYILADGGAMRQTLRCKSAAYKLETATLLQIEGTHVSGTWEDKTNSLGGVVTGNVTSDGFDIFLSGQFFQAWMKVAGSGCQQSVTVRPEKAEYIRELTASLKKC